MLFQIGSDGTSPRRYAKASGWNICSDAICPHSGFDGIALDETYECHQNEAASATFHKPQIIEDNVYNVPFPSGTVIPLHCHTQALVVSCHTEAPVLIINDTIRAVYAMYKSFNCNELLYDNGLQITHNTH